MATLSALSKNCRTILRSSLSRSLPALAYHKNVRISILLNFICWHFSILSVLVPSRTCKKTLHCRSKVSLFTAPNLLQFIMKSFSICLHEPRDIKHRSIHSWRKLYDAMYISLMSQATQRTKTCEATALRLGTPAVLMMPPISEKSGLIGVYLYLETSNDLSEHSYLFFTAAIKTQCVSPLSSISSYRHHLLSFWLPFLFWS